MGGNNKASTVMNLNCVKNTGISRASHKNHNNKLARTERECIKLSRCLAMRPPTKTAPPIRFRPRLTSHTKPILYGL